MSLGSHLVSSLLCYFFCFLKKSIAEYKGGSKNPSYKMAFEVLFLTEDGKKMAFEVPEELYARVSEGQSGRLMTIGGNFLDFGE